MMSYLLQSSAGLDIVCYSLLIGYFYGADCFFNLFSLEAACG